jgi:phospholipase C
MEMPDVAGATIMKTKDSKRIGRTARKSKSSRAAPAMAATVGAIEHVIVLMLENRSFDHVLGSMQSMYPNLVGIDPAKPGVNYEGPTAYPQRPDASFLMPYGVDPKHEPEDVQEQLAYNGPCGGFVHNFIRNYRDKKASAPQVMAYFDRGGTSRLPVLHTLAESFTICDHWFSSVPGPTWTNRFFVHSGTSNGWVKMPTLFHHWHNYNQTTVYDRLNERNISWRIYHDGLAQSQQLEHQRKPKNAARYRDIMHFRDEVAGPEDQFPQYVFIEPNYFGGYENDQHPPANMLDGEVLIARIYNGIRANQALWQKSLLVVLYDEHGGFYDSVIPPAAIAPDNKAGDGFDFKQYGLRVPALLISPYAPRGVLSEVLDHTSLLRYLSDQWGLGSLGARTAAANSFASALLSSPRTDTPAEIQEPNTDVAVSPSLLAATPKAGATARSRRTKRAQPPLNDLQSNLLVFSQVLDAEIKEPDSQKVRRLRRSMKSAEAHIAVGQERLRKFLAQQKRRARVGKR